MQDGIYDEFMSGFLKKTESIRRRMGNRMLEALICDRQPHSLSTALNPDSTMGTVISYHHLQRIEEMVRRSRGNIVTGGTRMLGTSELDGFDFSRGSFFPPTIISDINSTDELWKEEVFGPVVIMRRFSVGCLVPWAELLTTDVWLCRKSPKVLPWLMIVNTGWEQQYGQKTFLGHIEWRQKLRPVYAGSTLTIAMTRVPLGMVFEMEKLP